MALLVWPLLVYAYYKRKYTLKNWLLFFVILGSIVVVLGSGAYAYIALVAQLVSIPIVFLSARFTAWCIRWHVNRKKTKITQTNDKGDQTYVKKA